MLEDARHFFLLYAKKKLSLPISPMKLWYVSFEEKKIKFWSNFDISTHRSLGENIGLIISIVLTGEKYIYILYILHIRLCKSSTKS